MREYQFFESVIEKIYRVILNDCDFFLMLGTFFINYYGKLDTLINTLAYVLWRTINLGRQISDISKKSMQATIYCHYD
jgi:hypothetical protein